jgi:hypothetical protein
MTPRPLWLGNFFGGSLDFLNYEVLTIQHIPAKDLAKEPTLMQSKWFDYRRLHPMQATYLFMRRYNDAYRAFHRMAVNADAAPFVRAIKGHDFLEAKEKMSFWRLRQRCDELGMRYEFFLGFAMRWMHRLVGDGRVLAPRPSMLLNNQELLTDAMLAWEEQCETALQVARDPYFRVSNFMGHDTQRAHEQFVIEQIKRRKVPHYSLHAAIYLFDAVRVEEALRHFDVSVIDRAIKEVRLPD